MMVRERRRGNVIASTPLRSISVPTKGKRGKTCPAMPRSGRSTRLQPHALVGFQPQWLLSIKRVAGDKVGEAVAYPIHPQPVSIHFLGMSGEIRYHEESLTAAVTDVAEEMPVAGLDERGVTIVNRRLLLAQRDQPHQFREYAAMWRVRVALD